MSQDLKARGIRFIYVALPGKLDVYPEIVFQDDLISEGVNVNPAARNFLDELLKLDVEVVDCYPEMIKQRHLSPLFSRGHHISLEGAKVIADILSGYLERTTCVPSSPSFHLKRSQETVCMPYYDRANPFPYNDVMDMSKVTICDGVKEKPYLANEVESQIAVIGNCNLQSYEFTGGGIPSNLAFNLKYPVTYLGRYLPFAPIDRVNQLPRGSLYGMKILLYVGFVSAPFVRAPLLSNLWNIDRIPQSAFIGGE